MSWLRWHNSMAPRSCAPAEVVLPLTCSDASLSFRILSVHVPELEHVYS